MMSKSPINSFQGTPLNQTSAELDFSRWEALGSSRLSASTARQPTKECNAVTSSLDSWLTTRGLQMNTGKTQAMFVLPRGLNIPPDTVVMCNSRQSTSACDIIQVSWCVFRQPSQLGGSDLAHHQESLAKDWGLVTRWSATDFTCKTIILHGHHCCRH